MELPIMSVDARKVRKDLFRGKRGTWAVVRARVAGILRRLAELFGKAAHQID